MWLQFIAMAKRAGKPPMTRTAGVREFRDKLSKYLRGVEHGETVLLTDHGRPIAYVVPTSGGSELTELPREEREARQLLEDGLVSHLGTQDEGEWPKPMRVLKRGQLQKLLDAEREERL
jgi:prevent-host-death family protein